MVKSAGREHPELIALSRVARRLRDLDRERFLRVVAVAERCASDCGFRIDGKPSLRRLRRTARALHKLDRVLFLRVVALAEAYVSVYDGAESDGNPDEPNPDLAVDAWLAAILPPRHKTFA